MLEVKKLIKEYKHFALKDLDFKIELGFITGLVGKNGAGKTTLFNILNDYEYLTSGSYTYDGKKMWELDNQQKQQIALVSIDSNSLFYKTANLKICIKQAENMYLDFDRESFDKLAKRLELPLSKAPRNYSTGEFVKLVLAIQLAHKPKYLFIDEGLSVIDPVMKETIFSIFKEFVADEQHSIFISSQVITDLEEICDQLIILKNGRILMNINPMDIKEKYCVFTCTKEDLTNIDRGAIITIEDKVFYQEVFAYKNRINGSLINIEQKISSMITKLLKEEDENETI